MPKLQTTISQIDMSPYEWAVPKKTIGTNTKGRINLLMFKYLIRCKRQVYLWEQCFKQIIQKFKSWEVPSSQASHTFSERIVLKWSTIAFYATTYCYLKIPPIEALNLCPLQD
jgi:hypothetical protein